MFKRTQDMDNIHNVKRQCRDNSKISNTLLGLFSYENKMNTDHTRYTNCFLLKDFSTYHKGEFIKEIILNKEYYGILATRDQRIYIMPKDILETLFTHLYDIHSQDELNYIDCILNTNIGEFTKGTVIERINMFNNVVTFMTVEGDELFEFMFNDIGLIQSDETSLLM